MEDLEDKEDFEEFENRQNQEKGREGQMQLGKQRDLDAEEYDSDVKFQENNSDSADEYGEELDRDGSEQDEGGYISDPELMTAQRDYRFGGDDEPRGRRNEGRSASRKRGQSAKGARTMDEKNLRNVKLTNKDYI